MFRCQSSRWRLPQVVKHAAYWYAATNLAAPHAREEVVARAHMRRFEAGDTIFLMGALNNSMMAVLKGEVTNSEAVRAMLRGIRRSIGSAKVRKAPILTETARVTMSPNAAQCANNARS
jgi:hypothetical protein